MFDFFESKEAKRKKSHIKNLVALAKLDGHVTKEELGFLLKIGDRNGVKNDDVKKMILRTTTVKVTKPANDSDRFDYIYDLIEMTLVDGVMDEDEIDYCVDMSAKLGFRPAISGVLVRKIAVDIMEGLAKEDIRSRVESFLTFKK
jgi:hypothetical protein